MAGIARAGRKQPLPLEFELHRIAVPGDGKLRRGLSQPIRSSEIGHQPFLSVNRQPNKQYKGLKIRPQPLC